MTNDDIIKNSYETNVTANNNSYYKKWEKNNEYIENKNSGNLNTFHYIWVQFESEIYPGTFYWNTYTYKTMKTFHFWDIIYAPTSNWTKKARVLETNKSIIYRRFIINWIKISFCVAWST